MIEIKNLSKVYGSGADEVEALKKINLTVNDGDIFGIMGLSGAGKSSLIRCINLLERPTSGEIIINGSDITKLNPKQLRETRMKIGMIFQHFNLLMNSTVYENIAFPLKLCKVPEKEIQERVNKLLDIVELSDKKDFYPSKLSGGQKQRVGIARALANNPEIILSDEATSALDPTTTESILSLLKNINKEFGITIVVITHEMSVIKNLCNKVAVLEDGLIVEEGNVVEVFSNPQTNTAKKFLKDMMASIPQRVLKNHQRNNEKLLRVSFIGETAEQPFISDIVKRFNVDANIISGNIETVQETQIGNLIIKLSGEDTSIDNSIKYLIDNNLRIEVIQSDNI